MMKNPINLAIFASGNGSNFSAIVKTIKQKKIKVRSVILVCDKPEAFVIQRAQKAKIPVVLIRREDFVNRGDFEEGIVQRLKNYKINLIVLAGFMRILSVSFVKLYHNRVMNIHPSLLPDFKGAHAIEDAFKHKPSFTGVTVHFIDEQVDNGPVILQQKVKINKSDSLFLLERRIHALEHKLYPEAIKLFVNAKLKIRAGKVYLG